MTKRPAGKIVQIKMTSFFNGVFAAGISSAVLNAFLLLDDSPCFALFGFAVAGLLCWSAWWFRHNPTIVVDAEGVLLLAPARARRLPFEDIISWQYEQALGGMVRFHLRSGRSVTRSAAGENLPEFEAALRSMGISRVA